LDTENEELNILENECNFFQNIKSVMDSFIENNEVLENLIDIIEVLLKKAHAGTLDHEIKGTVTDFGYQFFN